MPQLNKTANAETNLFFSGNVLYNYLNVNIVFIDIPQKSLHYYYDFLIMSPNKWILMFLVGTHIMDPAEWRAMRIKWMQSEHLSKWNIFSVC